MKKMEIVTIFKKQPFIYYFLSFYTSWRAFFGSEDANTSANDKYLTKKPSQ